MKSVCLYGTGKLGQLAKEIFNELKLPVTWQFDQTMGWGSIQPRPEDVIAVCIATAPYEEIHRRLLNAGFSNIYPVWDIIEQFPAANLHNGFRAMLTLNAGLRVLDNFDDLSKAHYLAFFSWATHRIESSKTKPEPRKSLPSTLADIRARQKVVVYDIAKTIDVHTEGLEMHTICINMKMFQRHRPVVAVACYHSEEGLVDIPTVLMENLNDYNFRFRIHAYMGQGAYLYCLPKEEKGQIVDIKI